jgi:L-iditol 2-dehydrogenase
MKQAIDYARKGSTIVVVGVFADLGTINMGFIQDHELTLVGTAMYREEDYVKSIELVGAGLIDFDTLITHRFKFRDYTKAYELIDKEKDKAMKVMIEME